MRACLLALCLLTITTAAAAQSAEGEKFDPAAVLKQLQSPDREVRKAALWAIDSHRKEARGLVGALVAALKHPDLATRYQAAYVLTSVDPEKAGPALPILKDMLRSDVEMNGTSPRMLGPTGLGRLGREGADALVEALADANTETRIAASHGLMDSEVFPPTAVPAMLKAARGPDAVVRHQVLNALLYRQVPAEQMIPPLLDALIDPDPSVRATAASGLGGYRREAIRALEALKQTTKDDDEQTAVNAASAVALIDREAGLEYLPLFIKELSRPDSERFRETFNGDLRLYSVAAALEALGPDAGRALPALKRAFERETGYAKLDLGIALVRVDPGSAGPVVAFLIEDLEQGHDMWRYGTLLRIAELGKIAADAAPTVARFTTSADPMIRDAATKALAAIKR